MFFANMKKTDKKFDFIGQYFVKFLLLSRFCRDGRFRQYVRNGYSHPKTVIHKKKYEPHLPGVRTVPFLAER